MLVYTISSQALDCILARGGQGSKMCFGGGAFSRSSSWCCGVC